MADKFKLHLPHATRRPCAADVWLVANGKNHYYHLYFSSRICETYGLFAYKGTKIYTVKGSFELKVVFREMKGKDDFSFMRMHNSGRIAATSLVKSMNLKKQELPKYRMSPARASKEGQVFLLRPIIKEQDNDGSGKS